MSDFSFVTHLECVKCKAQFPLQYILKCEHCSGLLEFHYDLKRAASANLENNRKGIWRFHPLLPIGSPEYTITMGEGNTPLISAIRHGKELGARKLFLKYEGSNPTGTFKDRSSATAVSAARQFGFKKTAVVTTGNAGASIAAYSARAGRPRHEQPQRQPQH